MIWCNWVGSSPGSTVPTVRGTVETMRLDWSACYTPWSSTSIQLYIYSYFTSCFSNTSCEASFTAAMMKLKSSNVRVVCILVTGVLAFFREEYFGCDTFHFFDKSSSSLGGGTSPFYCSIFPPSISSPSAPSSGEMDVVLTYVLSTS
jgi:hypothetical protein